MYKNKYEHFHVSIDKGLSTDQVETRKRQGLVNRRQKAYFKSTGRIIASNFFSFFNIVLCLVIAALIYFKIYTGLYIGLIVIANIVIGLYQDIGARNYLKKDNQLAKALAVRNSQKVEISANDIVVDDILYVEKGSVVYADATIVHGDVCVNESLLSGVASIASKGVKDQVAAGSIVDSGSAHIKVENVSSDCLANTLHNKASRILRSKSIAFSSLQIITTITSIISILIAALIILTFVLNGTFGFGDELKNAVEPAVNAIVMTVPASLFLISAIILLVESTRLHKDNVKLQNPYSIETLSKTDVVCIDKTGTITDGELIVKKIIPLTSKYMDVYIAQNVANVLRATKDQNEVSLALLKHFDLELTAGVNVALPFNSENNYSGASFKGGKTFILGGPDYVPIRNKIGVTKRCEEFTKEGSRVVVLCEGKDVIKDGKYIGILEPIALIVLKDRVREGVIEAISWFKQNNINIKVISGDNPLATSAISAEAGVPNANKYISLKGRMLSEMKILAEEYTVFGDASPEQKEALVAAIKESKKTVTMIANGINDILAMRRANCAIAFDSACVDAKNTADIILADQGVDKLPEAVKKGGIIANSLEKVATLFVVKTIFTTFISLAFVLMSVINKETYYPFVVQNFYLWDLAICIVGVLLLSLFNKQASNKERFLSNILKEAIPGALLVIVAVSSIFAFYYMQQKGILNLGFYSKEDAVTISVTTSIILGNVIFYKLCLPFDKNRVIAFICSIAISLVGLIIAIILTCLNVDFGKEMFNISFSGVSGVAYMTMTITIVVITSIYLFINRLVVINKGEELGNED